MMQNWKIALVGLVMLVSPSALAEVNPTLQSDLQAALADARKDAKLVGAGAAILHKGELVAIAADGKRKKGAPVPVTINDKWHIGSITKSMTATMIATLVERGELRWDMTVPQAFADIAKEIDPGWSEATLAQLVSHRAGAPANFGLAAQMYRPDALTKRRDFRAQEVAKILAEPPVSTPGTAFLYSNIGLTIAGAIAEAATDTPWETLMQRQVFEPLGLDSAGFGPPRGTKPLDQPWGHRNLFVFKLAAKPEADNSDNTPLIGPAGTVHISMPDLLAFAQEHLDAPQAKGKILAKQSAIFLHTPHLQEYAAGWVVYDRPWAGGPLIWHNGSNLAWYALLVLLPEKDLAMVFVSNDGAISEAESAFFRLAKQFAERFETQTAVPPAK